MLKIKEYIKTTNTNVCSLKILKNFKFI